MALISKISRLNRIPQLLNKKRESDREEKRKREDSSERPPFPFNQRLSFKRTNTTSQGSYSTKEMETARARKQGIGRRIDVLV